MQSVVLSRYAFWRGGGAELDTKNIYYDNVEGFYLKAGTYLRIYRITEMEQLLCDKPVFAKYVRLLDFHFKGFYEDYETIRAEKLEEIDGYPVNCIEDFLYKENGIVIISGCHIGQAVRKMGELGFQYWDKFVLSEPFALHYLFVRQNALDINMGNSFVGISKYAGLRLPERNICQEYPGFCVYGEYRKNSYKIVTLGDSTTDGHLFGFKSWPEIMFDRFADRNVTVWNGGVAGYTSSHGVIKFIRDVLPMKPDMVIIFDGYNDTCQGNPAHPYSFLQPMLMSKSRDKREEEIYMSSRQFYEEELYLQESFRDKLQSRKRENAYEFIYDLSSVFDDVHDVYMDICHVCGKGNKIIADAIYDVIKNEIR